jgi:hypothetical protein
MQSNSNSLLLAGLGLVSKVAPRAIPHTFWLSDFCSETFWIILRIWGKPKANKKPGQQTRKLP